MSGPILMEISTLLKPDQLICMIVKQMCEIFPDDR